MTMTLTEKPAVVSCIRETCDQPRKYADGLCATCRRRQRLYGHPGMLSLTREMLPIEPLERYLQRQGVTLPEDFHPGGARQVSIDFADRIACKFLRVHPSTIWAEWFEIQYV